MKSKTISLLNSESKRHFSKKRVFDFLVSTFVLVCFSPLFLLIGFLIFFSSPGNIIFSQDRIGLKGKVFRCYKFRTMHVDAEEKLGELLARDSSLRMEWEKKQKLQRDPRVFFLGKILRKTSLDELPQFWNVLKGDLSIVGPRPYMVSQKKDLKNYADQILSIRPGITGLWQVSGRSKTTFLQRIELDASYVEKRSFWFDLSIMVKTIPVMFFFKDAC